MTLLSRKVDYALLILSYLHHRPDGSCAREIAERLSLSRPFVANILKRLCSEGYVAGRRGVKGGYVLRRPAEEVCLAELMESLGEPFHLAECNRTPCCGSVSDRPQQECGLAPVCPVRNAVGRLHRRLLDVLRTVTLAELFDPEGDAVCTQFGLTVSVREPQLTAT
jgi:Rrf2 family cysteine metabolism transcriptional repressor